MKNAEVRKESAEREPPLVSVVMPAYNSQRFIGAALESVLAQTLEDWELIAVEDCSTDRTWRILKKYAAGDDRIRIVRNDRNRGAAWSRNRAFGMCQGRYIALLDSDDLWQPEKLEKQVRLAERTGADIIYCSYSMIDEEGKKRWKDFIVPKRISFEQALSKSVMSCSTTLLTRQTAEEFPFPENLYHEDLFYWLTLLQAGKKAAGIRQVLAAYRVRTDSRASNKARAALNRWRVYRYLGLSPGRSVRAFIRYARLGISKYRAV